MWAFCQEPCSDSSAADLACPCIVDAAIQKHSNSNGARHFIGKDRTAIPETAFGSPRDFLNNRFVYAVISARARGLALGVNMNPDRLCSFNCVYCEVDRRPPLRETKLDVDVMAAELHKSLAFVMAGKLHERPWYSALSGELLTLRHVALSGDGEPTLAPNFAEAVESIVHIRALGEFPFFKIVLITNATGLDRPQVQQGLKHFTKSDEIWAKLDGGTQSFFNRVDRSGVSLDKVLSNILLVGRQRPVIIQSLFTAINDEEPPALEIEEYAYRLKELKAAGANIPLVQIYSATRPMFHADCGHLPLKTLSHIAHTVRHISGLKAEVF
jgi:wyosine [tRNA(Phe)-imidazoG37] synthetase (radical SAM superfamily)